MTILELNINYIFLFIMYAKYIDNGSRIAGTPRKNDIGQKSLNFQLEFNRPQFVSPIIF